jgi:hypothetical protein
MLSSMPSAQGIDAGEVEDCIMIALRERTTGGDIARRSPAACRFPNAAPVVEINRFVPARRLPGASALPAQRVGNQKLRLVAGGMEGGLARVQTGSGYMRMDPWLIEREALICW